MAIRIDAIMERLDQAINWFIPEEVKADPELHQREMRQIVGIEDERMLSWQGRSAILSVPQTEIPTFEWVRKASAYSGGVER